MKAIEAGASILMLDPVAVPVKNSKYFLLKELPDLWKVERPIVGTFSSPLRRRGPHS